MSSHHTVKATFTFKDQESKEKFIVFCNGENGLSVTRGWDGCVSIDLSYIHFFLSKNPTGFLLWQSPKSECRFSIPSAHTRSLQGGSSRMQELSS